MKEEDGKSNEIDKAKTSDRPNAFFKSREFIEKARNAFRTQERFRTLCLLLEYSDDLIDRIIGARELGFFGEAGLSFLQKALKEDEHWRVRKEAAISLGKTGTLKATTDLENALNDPVREVQYAAAEALDILKILSDVPSPEVLKSEEKASMFSVDDTQQEFKMIDLEKYNLVNQLSQKAFDALYSGKLQTALELFEYLIELEPEYAGGYQGKGTALEQMEEFKSAIDFLNKAIELDDSRAEVFERRAMCHRWLGDLDRAMSDFNKAIELNPENAQTWFNSGTIQMKLGRLEEAVASFTKSIEINPTYSLPYFNRGAIRLNTGDCEGAIEDLDIGLQYNPNSAEAYLNRGIAHFRLEHKEQAIEDIEKAIHLNPELEKHLHG